MEPGGRAKRAQKSAKRAQKSANNRKTKNAQFGVVFLLCLVLFDLGLWVPEVMSPMHVFKLQVHA
jgi:hypothetical protein